MATKRLKSVPKGFRKTIGASNAPRGFEFYNNGISRFDKKGRRKIVLVKIRSKK